MIRTEAEKFARGCLYSYREEIARLEQKRFKLETLSSSKSVEYGNESGKSSAHYVDSVPWWLEVQEQLEHDIRELELKTRAIARLLADIFETDKGAHLVYELKYDKKLSWEKAKAIALEKCDITDKMFRRLHCNLVSLAISYLDIAIDADITPFFEKGPEKGPETDPKIGLESTKKAC